MSLLAMFLGRVGAIVRLFVLAKIMMMGGLMMMMGCGVMMSGGPDDDAHWPDAWTLPWRYTSQPFLENYVPVAASIWGGFSSRQPRYRGRLSRYVADL
jgi:hypothetical protein